jgi:ADP-dependent NAD(P)H-hydrate dehydratase / NAD(P)H-hydrate epimerase
MFRGDFVRTSADALARTTVVCGCGGGDAVRPPLPRLLGGARRLVLDADALNALAHDSSLATLLRARSARGLATVLTPHPLEAARLLGCTTAQLQADRLHAAAELADRFACCVVLKGSGSVIAAPSQAPRINSTGNAALASAGTGDVLAGWLGGRWAQQPGGDEAAIAFLAARHAVAEHGAAAEPQPKSALRAGDLIERLYRL